MVMNDLLFKALYETLLMVFGSTGIGILLGLPVGVILYSTSQQGLQPCKKVYGPLSFLVNGARSIPYIILTVLLIPFTRNIIGTSIGTGSAIVPLSIAAALLIARCVEDALQSVPKGLSEVGISLGATPFEIIRKILLPESMAPLIAGITTVIINLVGYSAMAGTVGGGGLGDLAIRYGYQRYDTILVILIVVILVILVQCIQMLGQRCANHYRR
jgi:D-methionine transport system permease protein